MDTGILLCLVNYLCLCPVLFTSIGMLCVGEMLGGLAYGFYVIIAPTYASEVCPLALRGLLTAAVNLAFVIGQFIAQGCAAGFEKGMSEWTWKTPFVIHWIWPAVLVAGLLFAPESPYWLVRKGDMENARKSLLRLTAKNNRPDIDAILTMIEHTDLLEREIEATTTYFDCAKGINVRPTEISVMVYLIQVIGGNPLIGYANYFFEKAGLSPADSFDSKRATFRSTWNSCLCLAQWESGTPPWDSLARVFAGF